MTRDEQLEFYSQVQEVKQTVVALNGPYKETTSILHQLDLMHETWVEDEIVDWEVCEKGIVLDETTSQDEGGWFCKGNRSSRTSSIKPEPLLENKKCERLLTLP
ncbi:hypothetical protein [Flexibacterium corallicola]|uniref:hypothetical protein n=1 Tax=Flexibacterium corallicola TaxID=3037259 RepID=UPI00286F945A|nr:hypothetical protein [Pseudovibrio sp. M1P-2-3]